jgi:hypothetical protein
MEDSNRPIQNELPLATPDAKTTPPSLFPIGLEDIRRPSQPLPVTTQIRRGSQEQPSFPDFEAFIRQESSYQRENPISDHEFKLFCLCYESQLPTLWPEQLQRLVEHITSFDLTQEQREQLIVINYRYSLFEQNKLRLLEQEALLRARAISSSFLSRLAPLMSSGPREIYEIKDISSPVAPEDEDLADDKRSSAGQKKSPGTGFNLGFFGSPPVVPAIVLKSIPKSPRPAGLKKTKTSYDQFITILQPYLTKLLTAFSKTQIQSLWKENNTRTPEKVSMMLELLTNNLSTLLGILGKKNLLQKCRSSHSNTKLRAVLKYAPILSSYNIQGRIKLITNRNNCDSSLGALAKYLPILTQPPYSFSPLGIASLCKNKNIAGVTNLEEKLSLLQDCFPLLQKFRLEHRQIFNLLCEIEGQQNLFYLKNSNIDAETAIPPNLDSVTIMEILLDPHGGEKLCQLIAPELPMSTVGKSISSEIKPQKQKRKTTDFFDLRTQRTPVDTAIKDLSNPTQKQKRTSENRSGGDLGAGY